MVLPPLQLTTVLAKAKSSPDFTPISPRSQRHSALDSSIRRSKVSAIPTDPRLSYRSPTVQNKHEILLLLKELRKGGDTPTIRQAKTVSQVLDMLAREKGYYSEEMTMVAQEVSRVVFCEKGSIPEEVLQFINQQDVELLLQEDSQIPFFYITDFLYRLIALQNAQHSQLEQSISAQALTFQVQLASKDAQIRDFQRAIEEMKQAQKPIEMEIARGAEEVLGYIAGKADGSGKTVPKPAG